MPAATPTSEADAKEDRFRVALGFAMALLIASALGCCCLGGLLVSATDDGHQTRSGHHGLP